MNIKALVAATIISTSPLQAQSLSQEQIRDAVLCIIRIWNPSQEITHYWDVELFWNRTITYGRHFLSNTSRRVIELLSIDWDNTDNKVDMPRILSIWEMSCKDRLNDCSPKENFTLNWDISDVTDMTRKSSQKELHQAILDVIQYCKWNA